MDGFFKRNGKRDQYAKMVAAYEKAKASWDKKHPPLADGFEPPLPVREFLQKPFPPSRVSYDDEGVHLYVCGKFSTYDIPWDDINDEGDVLGWIKNFCAKTWSDANLIDDFIDCCRHYRKHIRVSDFYD